MFLVRAWRRELLGGLAAALIAPAALVGALAVLAVAGGFAGLGALGQVFAGPSLSAAVPGEAPGTHARRPVTSTVLLALAASGHGSSRPAGAVAPKPGAPAARAPQARPAPGVGSGRGARPGTGSPPPARRPSPAAPAHPTLTDQLVGTGASASSQLPGPAGPPTTQALQAAGSTADGVFPVPAPGPALAPPQLP